ncbi:MAG: HAMP domain-containing histidine kinase [Deltaproteobacteria bacterium]|nr:HAMP domain-containing histidine kinase [Deltaproteobacteria bacterium]
MLQARDLVAQQALGRAHELELMSSRLSHELKNPLGAIKALVQLSARSAADAETRERLQVVEGEVERMQGILQDYLTFSRPLESLQLEEVALGELADEVLSVLDGRAKSAGVTLQRAGEARAHVDPRRVKEALVNLVANAIEASPRGGAIEVGLATDGGQALLSVRDHGCGMSPEVLARLGTPFFTTRDDGNGLGVLLARGVFRQHGGSLEYVSEPGQGTTVMGRLPLKEEASHGARAAGR